MKLKGFSIAEMTVVLGAISVLAIIALPALTHNKNQLQFSAGYKKGVTLLNNAISMNITNGSGSALKTTRENPLYTYLQDNLKVIKKAETSKRNSHHSEFFTPDGMRFEFPKGTTGTDDEFSGLEINETALAPKGYSCGTKNFDNTGSAKARQNEPCVVLLDVNGDDPPNRLTEEGGSLSDMFIILVTDKTAVPYGETAQKAYYGH